MHLQLSVIRAGATAWFAEVGWMSESAEGGCAMRSLHAMHAGVEGLPFRIHIVTTQSFLLRTNNPASRVGLRQPWLRVPTAMANLAKLVHVSPEAIQSLEAKLKAPETLLPEKYRVLFSLRNIEGREAHEALALGEWHSMRCVALHTVAKPPQRCGSATC